MLLKAKISRIIFIFAMLSAASHHTAVANPTDVQQFSKGMESFGAGLYNQLIKNFPKQNIVFSPFSIHTCVTMARLGAEGDTAREMDQVLTSSPQKAEDLAKNYHTLLAQYENSTILKMANKMYVMTGYPVQDQYNALLTKHFYSSVDSLNFADSVAAAQAINTWVEKKTNNLIKNLVDPSLLDAATRLVLVNAIYFKGNWVHPFPEYGTREMDFYLDDIRTTKVQMMRVTADFKYAELPDLDATALEMPYKDSDLAMLVVLPNTRTGLADLEKKLQNTTLADITQHMYSQEVIVDMPKFTAEFQAELTKSFKEMGMGRMFTGDAEFGKMLKSGEGLQISSIIHKAFIEVNERGTEAAAATGMLIRKKRALIDSTDIKEFNIEHPFLFKIIHNTAAETSTPAPSLVLFAGKIEELHQNVLLTKTNFNEIKDEL